MHNKLISSTIPVIKSGANKSTDGFIDVISAQEGLDFIGCEAEKSLS